MARFEPRRVLPYLKSRWGRYRLHPVLEACRIEQSRLLTEAQAYLLEQDGRVEEAFQLLKADLVAELEAAIINSNHNSTNSSGSAAEQQLMWSRINTKVILLIQLCQTHCGASKSEENSSEGL